MRTDPHSTLGIKQRLCSPKPVLPINPSDVLSHDNQPVTHRGAWNCGMFSEEKPPLMHMLARSQTQHTESSMYREHMKIKPPKRLFKTSHNIYISQSRQTGKCLK